MHIIGLDPGIATVGFGVLRKGDAGLELVNVGVIKTPAGLDLGVRLGMIRDDLRELFDMYDPVHVGVEELFFETNAKTAMVVAQARGVIVEQVHRSGAQCHHFTPLQIKQAVTGDGRADKKAVQLMIGHMFGKYLPPKYDDAADALGVAVTTEAHLRFA